MTLTMIIAIIAAVIFSVFCFLCVYFLFNNQKDTRKNEERMKTLEYKMGLMDELINQKSDMLAERMAEQEGLLEAARTVQVIREAPSAAGAAVTEPKPEPEEPVEAEEELSLEDLFGELTDADFEDILTDDEPVESEQSVYAPQPEAVAPVTPEIEEVAFAPVSEIPPAPVVQAEPIAPAAPSAPVAPVKPVAPAAPVEPITPPQEIEERFEIGKSGKKYTFSELEKLIRE